MPKCQERPITVREARVASGREWNPDLIRDRVERQLGLLAKFTSEAAATATSALTQDDQETLAEMLEDFVIELRQANQLNAEGVR